MEQKSYVGPVSFPRLPPGIPPSASPGIAVIETCWTLRELDSLDFLDSVVVQRKGTTNAETAYILDSKVGLFRVAIKVAKVYDGEGGSGFQPMLVHLRKGITRDAHSKSLCETSAGIEKAGSFIQLQSMDQRSYS